MARLARLILLWVFIVGCLFFAWGLGPAEISVDVVENVPYIDYTLPFNNGFTIGLPDFQTLIYSKVLPEDINYQIKDDRLTVFDNKTGTLVLKYKGTDFLKGTKTYEKTLDFELIGQTKIILNTDTNIEKLTQNYIQEEDSYIWESNEKNFTLYVVLNRNPFDWKYILIIFVCVAIVAVLLVPIILKRYKKDSAQNLFLDSTQKNILDFVKKKKVATQQELATKLNVKKSNMSKILNKMERNDLIQRKKVGKLNKIILAEKKS